MSLAFNWSVNRTCACTSTTIDALFRVDCILVITSSDSFYRTFFHASAVRAKAFRP